MKKTLLIFIFLLSLSVTASSQSLYFGADLTGNDYNTIERFDIGLNVSQFSDVDIMVFTGYSKNFNKGDYIHLGLGGAYSFDIGPIPFRSQIDFRGLFGEYKSDTIIAGPTDSESAFASSAFLGFRLGFLGPDFLNKIAIGSTVEYYIVTFDDPFNSDPFINPVSLKISL